VCRRTLTYPWDYSSSASISAPYYYKSKDLMWTLSVDLPWTDVDPEAETRRTRRIPIYGSAVWTISISSRDPLPRIRRTWRRG